MTNTVHQKYDFDAAARVAQPVRVRINTWTQKAAELFVEQWEQFSQSQIIAVPTNVDCQTFEAVQRSWPKLSCGVAVSFGNEEITGMILAQNSELLALLLDVLGGTLSETTERQLTSIENDLANLVFEAVASSFGHAWHGQEALDFEIAKLEEEPCRSRMFVADEEVLLTGLRVQLGEATSEIQMVLQLDKTKTMLGVMENSAHSTTTQKSLPHDLIAQLKVSLSVELGSVKLNMSDLVAVQPGDVLVFDQPVVSPIAVLANGRCVFRGWPGRRFDKQAVQITSTQGEQE